jgi:hypothetical protein
VAEETSLDGVTRFGNNILRALSPYGLGTCPIGITAEHTRPK